MLGNTSLGKSRTFVFRPLESNKRDVSSPLRDEAHGLRLGWASSIRDVFQVVVEELTFGDPAWLDPAVKRLKRELPQPVNDPEHLHLRQTVAMFMDKAARQVHSRFHVRFVQSVCGEPPPSECEALWVNPARSIDQLLDQWLVTYSEWFERRHVLPPVLRAARGLRQDFASVRRIEQLAVSVGTSRTTLVEQFTQTFGLTPSAYLARVRVREGLCRLRASGLSVADVARDVGYQSENKFYARVRTLTGLKPSQVRVMDEMAFEGMLEARVPLCVPGRLLAERRVNESL